MDIDSRTAPRLISAVQAYGKLIRFSNQGRTGERGREVQTPVKSNARKQTNEQHFGALVPAGIARIADFQNAENLTVLRV